MAHMFQNCHAVLATYIGQHGIDPPSPWVCCEDFVLEVNRCFPRHYRGKKPVNVLVRDAKHEYLRRFFRMENFAESLGNKPKAHLCLTNSDAAHAEYERLRSLHPDLIPPLDVDDGSSASRPVTSDRNPASTSHADDLQLTFMIRASDLATPPKRVPAVVTRIVRDLPKSRELKAIYRFRCQVCRESISIDEKHKYAETHHIRPLGSDHGGPDVLANMLVLCPNHHAMFDLGIPEFIDKRAIRIGRRRPVRLLLKHAIGDEFTAYHNETIRGSAGLRE